MHAIRERRLGKVPPFVGRFLIGFGRSERKYAFSALGNTNKSTFSNFCELFAPRLLPHLNITVRNMRNLYFFWYRLIFIQLRSWVAFVYRYVAYFHPKVQISDVPDFTFINKIDLPNFRTQLGCLYTPICRLFSHKSSDFGRPRFHFY